MQRALGGHQEPHALKTARTALSSYLLKNCSLAARGWSREVCVASLKWGLWVSEAKQDSKTHAGEVDSTGWTVRLT